jgi:hypothetical protein
LKALFFWRFQKNIAFRKIVAILSVQCSIIYERKSRMSKLAQLTETPEEQALAGIVRFVA